MSPPMMRRMERTSEGLVHWAESSSEVVSAVALLRSLDMVVLEGLRVEIMRRMGMVSEALTRLFLLDTRVVVSWSRQI